MVAARSRGGVALNCVFTQNGVAVASYFDDTLAMTGCTIVNNTVGVKTDSGQAKPTGSNNNICGNTQVNVYHNTPLNAPFVLNWLGVRDDTVAYRDTVVDGRVLPGAGRMSVAPVLLSPSVLASSAVQHPCLQKPCVASVNCNNHGMCTGNGGCRCLPNWQGEACDFCPFTVTADGNCVRPCESYGSDCITCTSKPGCMFCASSNGCMSWQNSSSACSAAYDSQCPIGAVAVVSAAFDDAASSVLVSFSGQTNRGLPLVPSSGTFDCAFVLSFETAQLLGSGSRCSWPDDKTLRITLGGNFALRPYLDSITLRPTAVQEVRSGLYYNDTVVVTPPEVMPVPRAVLFAPFVHSACDPLLLDGSSSVDVTGVINALWECQGCSVAIASILQTSSRKLNVTIPSNLLQPGALYQFRLTVCLSRFPSPLSCFTPCLMMSRSLIIPVFFACRCSICLVCRTRSRTPPLGSRCKSPPQRPCR